MLNLENRVTVFVISVDDGDPRNINACKEALKQQDCTFQLKYITNVAPMNAAFQQMADRCDTPYFVQVDHDMILKPDAIRRLYTHLRDSDDKVAVFFLPLWDTHLAREIIGVKIYKHEVIKRFPWKDSMSCEVDQVARMKASGYLVTGICEHNGAPNKPETKDCAGKHSPFWTPQNIFRRYKRLMQKYRQFRYRWLEPLPKEFEYRFIHDPSPLNRYAYFGALAGLMSDIPKNEELDFNLYNSEEDFSRLEMYMHPPGPKELNLFVTPRCNMKCWHCRREVDEGVHEGTEMGAHLVDRLKQRFPSLAGACVAGFGEPLLNKETPNIIRRCKANKLFTSLITNGILLSKRLPELKGTGVDYISVSLNAATAAQHEKNTGTREFNNVTDGIRQAVQLGFTNVGISFIVHRDNYQEVPDVLALAADLGCGFVSLINLLPHFDNSQDKKDFLKLVIRNTDIEILDALRNYRGPGSNLINAQVQPIAVGEFIPRKCRSPFWVLNVDGMGYYGGCRRVFPPSKSIGHLDNHDPWNNPWFQNMRSAMLFDDDLKEECKLCFGNWVYR